MNKVGGKRGGNRILSKRINKYSTQENTRRVWGTMWAWRIRKSGME